MTSPLRLLLIDDDELDRLSLIRALRQGSIAYEVAQAETAALGLQLAAERRFDAILLDYHLPDKDGLQVLRTLRAGQFEGAAIIMISRQEDENLAEYCLEAGAQDFLLKDEVNGRRLSRAVRQARQRYAIEHALKHSREQLRQLSERDQLTGLTNRRGFESALTSAIARVQRSHEHLAILLLDLDDFKSINDTLGHDAGDVLLIKIARKIGGVVRQGDLLCRLGGDEFVVLMTNFAHDEHVVLLAERIVTMLQYPIEIGETEQIITTSIGIAVLGTCADNAMDLLKCADVAMYQAKQDGRNQARFYSVTLQETVETRIRIKRDLEKALKKNEFRIYYQAQIDSANGKLGGMEALVRWQHPTLGLLAPADFISVAEETGLIVDIGNWVLREGCKQLKEWQRRHALRHPKLVLAVNLSAVQIKQKNLFDVVKNTLAEYAVEASSLELEITESALIEDSSATVAVLAALVAQGITLSLDDFGTGYSSLDHLKLFPITVLKIDKGFVGMVGEGGKGERLFVAIIAFAKAMAMRVVVEGVETAEQAEFCIRHDCDLLQGYHYSRPVPAQDFEAAFLL